MVYADPALSEDPPLQQVLRQSLRDPRFLWAIGAFGAIAEFARDTDEPLIVDAVDDGRLATERGALVLDLAELQTVPVAYEMPSARPDVWLHGLALCLPGAAAAMPAGRVLTELGPDTAAVRAEHRRHVLFDLGTGAPQVEACIRTGDPRLLEVLRRHGGEDIIFAPSPAMAAIQAANPHRVFRSRLGRIEVYQRIGSRQMNPPTPEGPHTHVLPKLLASRRSHPANQPLPRGLVPCAYCFPPNPVFDTLGNRRSFDREAFDAFADLYRQWADPTLAAVKHRIRQAIAGQCPPGSVGAHGRDERQTAKVALRQLGALGWPAVELAPWRRAFDPPRRKPARGDAH